MNRSSLELVRDFRSVKEKRLAKELADIYHELIQKEKELASFLKDKDELLEAQRKLQEGEVELYMLESISQQLLYVYTKVENTKEELLEIKEKYEEKLNQLIEATKQRRLIEKLIERWKKRQQYEVSRQEQKFFDEISNNRFAYEQV